MPQITIKTTGTCFDDAPEIIMNERIVPKKDSDKARVVHGIVSRKSDKTKRKYAHAWVEYGAALMECCFDEENEKCVLAYSKYEFEATYRIYDTTKYTIQQLLFEGLKSPQKNTGPYKVKYLKLCKDWDEVKNLYGR